MQSLSVDGLGPDVFQGSPHLAALEEARNDPADPSSYRPIANLPVLSKLLERLVARQLLDYLNAAGLLPELQLAYRAHHSMETAVVRILSDILLALDTGDLRMLTHICQPRLTPSTTTLFFAAWRSHALSKLFRNFVWCPHSLLTARHHNLFVR